MDARERALKFTESGGDLILDIEATIIKSTYDALLKKAQRDPDFCGRIDSAALHVLQPKSSMGLLN